MLTRVARSHLCIACGHDLTRIHAPPDPHYQLPVVTCPACARSCVRRPYAGTARWREFGRRVGTARAGLVRLLAIVACSLAVVVASAGVGNGLQTATREGTALDLLHLDAVGRQRLARWYEVEGVYLVPVLVLAAVVAGFVCALGFPHWRPRLLPVGIAGVFLLLLLMPQAFGTPNEYASSARPLGEVAASNMPTRRDLSFFLTPFTVAAALTCATAGGARAAFRTRPRALGSRRLRRARKRRDRAS